MPALIALIVPLGLDSFAICAALGFSGLSSSERRRVAVLFPTFETAAPLLGLAIGAPLSQAIGEGAEYLAAAILIGYGAFLFASGEEDEEARLAAVAQSRGWAIVGLGLAISLDELAIGFSMGLLGLPLIPVLALIALQAVFFSQLGLRLGARVDEGMRERIERAAAAIMILVGLGLLVATAL